MKLRKDLVLREVGNDHVIVDPGQEQVDMSKIFTLNSSAAWLWNQLYGLEEFTAEKVVELLKEQYEVTEEQAREDVAKLIALFEKNDLLG